jgi:hypothetical protein
VQAQGETWNVNATTGYLIKIYRAENIVPNQAETKGFQRFSNLNLIIGQYYSSSVLRVPNLTLTAICVL